MKPVIALVGRPNVGKSTLFNRLTKSRDAIVADFAGLTRDRHYGNARHGQHEFIVIDTGGFQPDATGGSTIVVWPRNLAMSERESLFAYARHRGWPLIRGGKVGPFTTANMLLRLKGASPDYYGAYTPIPDVRTGVPCYFDSDPTAPWTALTGDTFVASPANIGAGAPMGVNCSVKEYLDGSCLDRLKTYISESGGQYEVAG